MKNAINILKIMLFIFCSSILYACSSHKDTAGSRAMQNLTSRYNYIYNANVILTTHQQELAEGYADNYDEVLPVYISPEKYDIFNIQTAASLPDMDAIIKKAQVILLEKSYGNYVDEAYMLLGKANFYKANYFNAVEYFDYTIKTFPNNTKSRIQSMDWKARSLMQLGKYSEASRVLDTLSDAMFSMKNKPAEPLATIAQIYIYQRKNAEAVNALKEAISAHPKHEDKVRWTYILAQLSEEQQNYSEALLNYRKVEKSNAPFEMYFNANLNRIRLNAFLNGTKINRQTQLLALLKDDKNLEYHDQVYYQIAESYVKDENYEQADKYYKLSVKNSTKNIYQKGLSYLKIADLNFKHFKDYRVAKSYYDSTVSTLPKTYPGFAQIVKKNQNLKYLTDRYELISWEDTLQSIAKLPETERLAKIQALANPVVINAINPDPNSNLSNPMSPFQTGNDPKTGKTNTSGTFYFANSSAVSTGYSDFKKKWGNRKLEDNWRQSIRSSAQSTIQDINTSYNTNSPPNVDPVVKGNGDKNSKETELKAAIPVTPELMARSDQKIIDAYYEIANFYLQELNDQKEASEVYQTLLARFPKNNRLAAIYYGMFLVNKNIDKARSEEYKNKVLKEFPSSTYAKTILDPSFSLKQTELETAINKQYNDLFEQYEKKDFGQVILRTEEILKASPDNYLSPQFAYLRAIAIGRTNNVDSLLTAFDGIKNKYIDDKLIVPLVKEHIGYINQHLADFKKRKIALIDVDPNEPRFFAQQFPTPATAKDPVVKPKTDPQVPVPPLVVAKAVVPKADIPEKTNLPVKTESMFSTAVSTVYYYVIDVADASLTLSSSRFGIGQFNRGNYAGNNLRHQLTEFDNDQLIFVGNFGNFDEAKAYASGIDPQLKQIMKVPANLYISFIISKENFDKLTSKDILNKYLEFYKNNY